MEKKPPNWIRPCLSVRLDSLFRVLRSSSHLNHWSCVSAKLENQMKINLIALLSDYGSRHGARKYARVDAINHPLARILQTIVLYHILIECESDSGSIRNLNKAIINDDVLIKQR